MSIDTLRFSFVERWYQRDGYPSNIDCQITPLHYFFRPLYFDVIVIKLLPQQADTCFTFLGSCFPVKCRFAQAVIVELSGTFPSVFSCSQAHWLTKIIAVSLFKFENTLFVFTTYVFHFNLQKPTHAGDVSVTQVATVNVNLHS